MAAGTARKGHQGGVPSTGKAIREAGHLEKDLEKAKDRQ